MRCYSIEPRTRKSVGGYEFLSFAKQLSDKYLKRLLYSATKTGLDTIKNCFQKVFDEAAEATGDFIGNEIVNKLVKPKPVIDENSGIVEELVIPPEKRQEILKKLRQVL